MNVWIWAEVQAAVIASSVASDSGTERAMFSRIVPGSFALVWITDSIRWAAQTLVECGFLSDDGEISAVGRGVYLGDVFAVEEDLAGCWFVKAMRDEYLVKMDDG